TPTGSMRQEKFYFRYCSNTSQISMNEIINSNKYLLVLVPLVRKYIDERKDMNSNTQHTVEQYLLFISNRAEG
ncbi:unnamed protein product, partial [Rotaria sp. Silwood2]